jgi:hypothetical protein
MTEQLELSILGSPLAAIDRRVLSQAWYSALHLADSARAEPATTEQRATAATRSLAKSASSIESKLLPARRAEPRAARRPQLKPPASATPQNLARIADRRIVPLSQRIERRFAQAPVQVRRATFSMGRGAARVFVVLQTNGSVATLIAFCRPEMRAIVARALAAARFALTAHGLVIDLQTRQPRCS